MKRDDIISLLTRLLGPLKIQPQPAGSNFEKFQGMLGAVLTQPLLETDSTGVQFPDFNLTGCRKKL